MNRFEGRDIEQQIDDVVVDLTKEFEGKVSQDQVREQVMVAYRRFGDSKITTYVPLLTRRLARESLRQPV